MSKERYIVMFNLITQSILIWNWTYPANSLSINGVLWLIQQEVAIDLGLGAFENRVLRLIYLTLALQR